MAAFLTSEQKQALGPLLGVLVFLVAICGGIAVYHMTGGQRIPFFSDVTPLILGVVGFFVIHRQLTR